MLPWLVILLNSWLPVDLVSLILPPDMSIAEDVPSATVIGQLESEGDEPAVLDLLAALPNGAITLHPVTSEVQVADAGKLDFEAAPRIVFLVRETRSKVPDLYRSLFIEHLARNGANPHHLERFTRTVRYRFYVIGVTDVDETTSVVSADDQPGDSPDSGLRVLAEPNTPQALARSRAMPLLEITPLGQIQSYLDRSNSSEIAGGTRKQEKTAKVVIPPMESENSPLGATAVVDHLSTVEILEPASSAMLAAETSAEPPIEVAARAMRVAATDTPTQNREHHSSAPWWLSSFLSAFLLSGYSLVLIGNRLKYRRSLNQKDRVVHRLSDAVAKQHAAFEAGEVCHASEILDEQDLSLLDACHNESTSDDAIALMEQCLSAWENLGSAGYSQETQGEQKLRALTSSENHDLLLTAESPVLSSQHESFEVLAARNSDERTSSLKEALALAASEAAASRMHQGAALTSLRSSQGHNGSGVLAGGSEDRESDQHDDSDFRYVGLNSNSLSDVERLQKLIREEFGIPVNEKGHQQQSVPHSSTGTENLHASHASVRRELQPIDFRCFREISRSASRQAIETSTANVRHQRIHSLLTHSAIGCSVVCGVIAVVFSQQVHIQLLLVSVSAFALLGYLKACRPPEA